MIKVTEYSHFDVNLILSYIKIVLDCQHGLESNKLCKIIIRLTCLDIHWIRNRNSSSPGVIGPNKSSIWNQKATLANSANVHFCLHRLTLGYNWRSFSTKMVTFTTPCDDFCQKFPWNKIGGSFLEKMILNPHFSLLLISWRPRNWASLKSSF